MSRIAFLHGLGSRPSTFRHLTSLSSGEEPLLLTLPGHATAPVSPLDIDRAADHVSEQLRAAAPSGDVTFVGHSMGGIVGAVLANRHPGLIDRLVILDSTLPLTPDGGGRLRSVRSALDSARPFDEVRQFLLQASGDLPQSDLVAIEQELRATDPQTVLDLLRSATSLDARQVWSRIPLPTLYFSSSRRVAPEEMAPINHRVEVVNSPGKHWPHLEQPEPVAEFVSTFIAKHARDTGAN